MGLSKIVIAGLFCACPLNAQEPNRVLYLLRQGHFQTAIENYEQLAADCQDYQMLQQMGLTLIEQGWKNSDPEIRLLSLFGAGISAHDQTLAILEDAVQSSEPTFQLAALNFLSNNYTDASSKFLDLAMRSEFLPIRLEAAALMAQRQHPKAAYQIESLMYKVPPAILPFFPQLLSASGDKDSITMLRKLMSHPLLAVRLEAILSAAKAGRDDLLPEIRGISFHHRVEEQEAAAVALGRLEDEESVQRLVKLYESNTGNVQIASLQALYRMGRENAAVPLKEMAKRGNLFAIAALGEVEQSEDILYELCQEKDLNIKINAALSLLARRDSRCLPSLTEILIRDSRDLALTHIQSIGRGLTACKIVPSAQQNFESAPQLHAQTLSIKEGILLGALQLPEKDFLTLTRYILDKRQNDLVPTLIRSLEECRSPQAIAILKTYREQPGAPLTRYWCNLVLYRMKEEGPYLETLKNWIRDYQQQEMIQFRPMLPWNGISQYQLTTEETSKLLVETYESLVRQQEEEGIALLLDAIKSGNPKNRYALAGLLIRATN